MIDFILKNIASIVVCLVILCLLILAVIKIIKDKKSGKSPCGCNCENCNFNCKNGSH